MFQEKKELHIIKVDGGLAFMLIGKCIFVSFYANMFCIILMSFYWLQQFKWRIL